MRGGRGIGRGGRGGEPQRSVAKVTLLWPRWISVGVILDRRNGLE